MSSQSVRIPKYYRISREIIDMIRSGEIGPGMQIPSENQIISQYGVSNTTARKIHQEIESTGWATRVKGKGTFVRERNVQRSANRILGFTRNMIEAGYRPTTKVLDASKIRADYDVTINGRRYTMPGPAYKIHRLRLANDIPMMIEVRYISMQFCPDIEQQDFGGSLYDIYEKHYCLQLREIRQSLSAVTIDTVTRGFFNVQEPIPAFRVEGVTFCGKEMILEMEDSIYRGDKYRFSVCATP
jgi:GntR family transcriptional regulator